MEDTGSRESVARELARAWRGIDAMRTWFWCGAAGFGVMTLCLAGSAWWVPLGLGLAAAVCVAGALGVRRRAAFWATVVAALLIPIGAALLVLGAIVMDIRALAGGLVAVLGSLASVRTMRRAEALIAAHPDHYAARRITGKPRGRAR